MERDVLHPQGPTLRWRGLVRVTTLQRRRPAVPSSLEPVSVEEFRNLVVDTGLDLFRDTLSGAVTDGQVKQVAFGDGTTTPANDDTGLVDEQFRKAVSSRTDGDHGVLTSTVELALGEANTFKIEEIGWFAGAAATATAGSGILVARVLYSRQKTSSDVIRVDRVDSIGR